MVFTYISFYSIFLERAFAPSEEEIRAEYRKKAHKDAMQERDTERYGAARLAAIILFIALVVMVKINS